MLEQAHRLLLHKLIDHIAEHCADRIKALVRLTNVGQTNIIKQYFLHDEDSHSFAKLRSGLHYSQAEWDDFGSQKEIDHVGGIVLYQGANDTERGESEVLKWTRFRCRIEERV